MLQDQPASASFFVAVAATWAVVFTGLELARRVVPRTWPAAEVPPSARPWLDLGVAVAVVAAVLGLGQLWHAGVLQWQWPGAWRHVGTALGHAVVWSPLPLALWLRRQPAASAWTGADRLLPRLAAGIVLAFAATGTFLLVRGEWNRWPEILARALGGNALAHALPIYMEGVGLAFLFVRLHWAVGRTAACVVPGVLFAAAHVPRALQDGDGLGSIAAFAVFNTVLVAVLLRLLLRHRDVVALGVAHWLTDLANGAL